MADKGRDIATGDGVLDLRVNHVGEESDAVLEECYSWVSATCCRIELQDHTIGDVHDAAGMLHDATVRVMLHLADVVEHAIARNAGVGVDDEDVVADADIAWDC